MVAFYVFMLLQPFVVFGIMDAQVVQDHVDFAVRIPSHDLIHERKKFNAPAAPGILRLHVAGRDVQGGKKLEVPWRLYSCEYPVIAFPLGSLSHPWARSSAWMLGFSSIESTTALSGG